MLQLSNVSFRYMNKPILQDVTFSIPVGQIIGLVGENGSGKSTLLKVLAGLLRPSSGEVLLNGTPVTRRSADEIAYLPDIDLFFDFYTGEQLFQHYASQFEDFSYDKACIVAEFLQVDKNVKLRQLSKGNRGRMKMAATLGREVPFYLMDEPFSGLDPIVREQLIKGLIQFTDIEHQTILLSTHELYEVEPILDQIILLQNGSIIAQEEVEMIRDVSNKDAVQWMKAYYKKG
ncbi:spermidine/putrescine ABC transporter ATP-binding protein [Lysinibacillus sphaericus]|uniref:ABC transporter ATP-binding protein n=1 Tax=Lysinibacillus sphaericus TaxID=1421 RepID=UPI0018CDC734|nr:ABC transporter ATP-binding protein [Lysinibacillus sphaericus]MBG9452959.1 spermidine/putrescine ABC transporter ATP-binding protein [Lysinibacillus sphaericus]MBG9480134.1 spermidine/putrescine ABC transporter ATP-binding protein [Lysinibacillus sphaericus]MBG9594012.1 spermidine/putrescine ABC transporter ATP-binding protein [Lysinibacillus sphaericus]